jgi:hypothetical protein
MFFPATVDVIEYSETMGIVIVRRETSLLFRRGVRFRYEGGSDKQHDAIEIAQWSRTGVLAPVMSSFVLLLCCDHTSKRR